MTRVLYVVLDGLADQPVPALGNRTPLEAAAVPFLGALTLEGRTGLVQTVGKGIAPESDVAVTAILGYDPFTYHTGRGVFEAVGSDMPFADGNLALRGNFATGGAGRTILDRRAGRDLASEDARALAEAVTRDVRLAAAPAELEVRASVAHRAAVVIRRRDGRLSAKISNTDPAYGRVGEGLGVANVEVGNQVERCRPLDDSEEARVAAALVNEFSDRAHEVLERHPANARRRERGRPPANLLLVRDAGDHLPKMPPIAERFGVEFGCFVEMPVERGIAELTGMTVIPVPPSGADKERVYTEWAHTAAREYKKHGGLYMHLKGPDEPGHDKDCRAKTEVIEIIDRAFFGTLLQEVPLDDVVILVTADHATPCILGRHSDDPVPLLVAGVGVTSDGSRMFNEAACARGSLGLLKGTDLMPLVTTLAKGG
ncbi:MAG TPA: 2,3-bisphosphoglycerate-independent phosphoglycerate mutase [bacterium]|nr:2,3-bisphosphoglycerate-independent phosphoglycerate mutase [bacterium]